MVDQCLIYGALEIPYKVLFVPQRQEKIAIHIHPDGSVQVDAPPHTELTEVKRAVSRRSRWICSHLERIKKQNAFVLPREYISGESHFYLGRRYVLKVKKNKQLQQVRLKQGQLQVSAPVTSSVVVKDLLWGWYRDHANASFARRLVAISDRLSWVKQAPDWKLIQMKKQWGSCTPKGTLNLNPHLVKAPARCIDYVLLHELCHLRFHNHSPQFYRLLSKHMSDWQSAKGQLDGMAELLLNE